MLHYSAYYEYFLFIFTALFWSTLDKKIQIYPRKTTFHFYKMPSAPGPIRVNDVTTFLTLLHRQSNDDHGCLSIGFG